jgi:hypothetical protein
MCLAVAPVRLRQFCWLRSLLHRSRKYTITDVQRLESMAWEVTDLRLAPLFGAGAHKRGRCNPACRRPWSRELRMGISWKH